MVSERSPDGTRSIDRALALLDAIAMDAGASPAVAIADALGLASSTGRRFLTLLERRGLIMRVARGRYVGGDRLRTLAARISPHAALIESARPVLRRLARELGGTAHLGMFENDMVTYLVKEGRHNVFTREHGALEAYCTGIGKALLAYQPIAVVDAYLALPLVRLTGNTITEPAALRAALEAVRREGYALDDREMRDDLSCVAVPLPGGQFAISVSGDPELFGASQVPRIAALLQDRARNIDIREKMPSRFTSA